MRLLHTYSSHSYSIIFFLLICAAVTVRLGEPQYRTTEGGVVEVCVIVQGSIDTTFSVLVETSDITAQGQLD